MSVKFKTDENEHILEGKTGIVYNKINFENRKRMECGQKINKYTSKMIQDLLETNGYNQLTIIVNEQCDLRSEYSIFSEEMSNLDFTESFSTLAKKRSVNSVKLKIYVTPVWGCKKVI